MRNPSQTLSPSIVARSSLHQLEIRVARIRNRSQSECHCNGHEVGQYACKHEKPLRGSGKPLSPSTAVKTKHHQLESQICKGLETFLFGCCPSFHLGKISSKPKFEHSTDMDCTGVTSSPRSPCKPLTSQTAVKSSPTRKSELQRTGTCLYSNVIHQVSLPLQAGSPEPAQARYRLLRLSLLHTHRLVLQNCTSKLSQVW